ncbi:hypothetical protein ACJJTC_015701 [Scirpophaga incertulas]
MCVFYRQAEVADYDKFGEMITVTSCITEYSLLKVTFKDVLGPASTHEAVEILQNDTFYSVATDASNHGAIKVFPLMVRFYSPTTNLKTCVLIFHEDSNETASAIHMNLVTRLKECNIETKHLTILCR